jgi:hypothetical protein
MATAPNAKEYREKAAQLRQTARQTKDPGARQDLLRLAADYEQLAASVERRGTRHGEQAD